MTRIHDLLVREGFEGSYDAVRRYATRWKIERRKDAGDGVTAFIPLMFRPGEAYQFDWSHEDVEIAGAPMRVKVAHRPLCIIRTQIHGSGLASSGMRPLASRLRRSDQT